MTTVRSHDPRTVLAAGPRHELVVLEQLTEHPSGGFMVFDQFIQELGRRRIRVGRELGSQPVGHVVVQSDHFREHAGRVEISAARGLLSVASSKLGTNLTFQIGDGTVMF